MRRAKGDPQIINEISQTLLTIKDYFKDSKSIKLQPAPIVQAASSNPSTEINEQSRKFAISEAERAINELTTYFSSTDLEDSTDSELFQMKAELSTKFEKVDKTAERYELILQFQLSDQSQINDVAKLGTQFTAMLKLKHSYTDKLDKFVKSRDIYKAK